MSQENSFLSSAIKQFEYYKMLGEQTFLQLPDRYLFEEPQLGSNSLAIIVKHLSGNMLSRWTELFDSDGEKAWRNRENEFESPLKTKVDLLDTWEKGWTVLLTTVNSLDKKDLERIIYIRNQGHTVTEAINRQLCHYAYHIGQIVYVGKMFLKEDWQSLSIPRGDSKKFNAEKFSKQKT